jgi:uncharacterized protein YkwD
LLLKQPSIDRNLAATAHKHAEDMAKSGRFYAYKDNDDLATTFTSLESSGFAQYGEKMLMNQLKPRKSLLENTLLLPLAHLFVCFL